MSSKRTIMTGLICAALCLLAAPIHAYDVYDAAVPDVDKPTPGDNSCWVASAANILAAGGWGTGATQQARADNIYTNDLMPHFGNGALTGWSSVATNWWLLNYGYNSDSASYDPSRDLNDVTLVRSRLTNVDYDFLLSELNHTQPRHVNVSFDNPLAEVGHEMTLAGGNYSLVHVPPGAMQVSTWHDNQGDLVAPPGDDDDYTNIWKSGVFWDIDRYQTPSITNDDWEAIGATIIAPGLQKPDDAMRNFDVAWYKDMDASGALFNSFRQAGTNDGVYINDSGGTDAYWVSQPTDPDKPELIVPNEVVENQNKEIWLLVDFIDRNNSGDPGIIVEDDQGNQYNASDYLWTADGGQVLVHWILDDQPAWEKIIFPDTSYQDLFDIGTGLGGDVKDWNLATVCVPEPATISLLAFSGLMLLRRKRT